MRFMPAALVAVVFLSVTDRAGAATTSCATVAACLLGTNSSSGPGVFGSSSSGFGVGGVSTAGHGVNGTSASSFGVVGITTQSATSPSNARAGVLGEDSSTNRNYYNSGVSGTSAYGSGVYGYSKNTTGVLGSSPSVGVCGNSDVSYTTPRGYLCQLSGPVGVSGNANKGWGVFAYSSDTIGLEALSDNGTGAGIVNLDDGAPALIVSGGRAGGKATAGTPLVQVQHTGGNGQLNTTVFAIDQVGNVSIGGKLTQNASSQYRTVTAAGTYLTSYGARESQPTLEDFGQARLSNGSAYVRLDSKFASAIDRQASYMVFITPNGNSSGLFVSQKTASGFEVHENGIGRSSLDFDYRIVAKPVDSAGSRLAEDRSPQSASYRLPVPHLGHK